MGDKINNVGAMLNNPKQRNIYLMGAGLAILAIIAGGYYATRPVKNTGGPAYANVASVPQVNVIPGSSTSARHSEMVSQSNHQDAEKAIKEEKTFIPGPENKNISNNESPIDALDKQIKAQKEKEEQEELAAKKPLINEPIIQEAFQAPVIQAPVIQQNIVRVQSPAKKYESNDDYSLIATLSGSWKIKESKAESVYSTPQLQQNGSIQQFSTLNSNANSNVAQNQKGALIAKAGSILNAILETGINSDEPSPVLAKIVSGDMKGARLIGKITNTGSKVIVEFNLASMSSSKSSLRVNAVAVDPATTRTALASDVDNHYFLKYGVLLGAAFLGAYSDAIGANRPQSCTFNGTVQTCVPTTALTDEQIATQAIGGVGKELANQTRGTVANIRPTITVNSGMAIGILIMEDLYENSQ
jgi:type IV secretory pathway VirB10-like protein